MQTGIYEGHQANAAFIVCGPPGFTTLALVNLGKQARKMYVRQRPVFCLKLITSLNR